MVCFMSEKDYEPDDVEPGLSEGDVHSGPGGYEGMGYAGGYAAEYRGRKSKVGDASSQSLDDNASNDDLEFEEFSDEGDA